MDPILDPMDEALEADLMRAGRSVRMSPELQQKTLAALGVGALATSATATAKASLWGWLTSKSGAAWTVGIVASVGVGGVVIAETVESPQSPVVVDAASGTEQKVPHGTANVVGDAAVAEVDRIESQKDQANAETAQQAAKTEERFDSAPTNTAKKPLSSQKTVPQASSATSLREELNQLAQVEAALRAKSSSRALQLLAAYRVQFPRPQLGLEAEVLNIQALYESGARGAANARATRFLERHPQSPLGARAKQYIK